MIFNTDSELNKAIWQFGIRKCPFRVRIRCSRKKSDAEDSEGQLYTVVTHVPFEREDFRGATSKTVQDE